MRDGGELDRRVATLEREVAELRQQLAANTNAANWLDAMRRDNRDEDGVQELVEIMRLNREAGVFDGPGDVP